MQATQFLISTLFDLYMMVVILRIWLQLSRADFYNPVSQFVVKATNPILVPLRRVIPGFAGIDWAGVVLLLLVAFSKVALLQALYGSGFPVAELAIVGAISVIKEVLSLIFWVMLIRVILSWVSQGYNPIEALLHQLTEPMLNPIRRVLPDMGGFDLSIMVFLIALKFVELLFEDVLRSFF
jgi:YggT family protein